MIKNSHSRFCLILFSLLPTHISLLLPSLNLSSPPHASIILFSSPQPHFPIYHFPSNSFSSISFISLAYTSCHLSLSFFSFLLIHLFISSHSFLDLFVPPTHTPRNSSHQSFFLNLSPQQPHTSHLTNHYFTVRFPTNLSYYRPLISLSY